MSQSVKDDVLRLIQTLWSSQEFDLQDTDRSRRLREGIVRNLLSLVMTDDERAKLLSLPDGCRVRESAKIISPENFRCGTDVWIGENTLIDASGHLSIGDHTTIAVGAMIWTHESVLANLSMDNAPGNAHLVRKPVSIGSGCYIGGPSSIYPGVTLGDRVVVLPMSVVTKSFPSNVLLGGSPARVVRSIDDQWLQAYRQTNGLHA